jgi:hypothetical protein
MHMNQLFGTRTDVGAIIHYALDPLYTPVQGVMNDGPYIFITAFICECSSLRPYAPPRP